jgi:hypothetical protein
LMGTMLMGTMTTDTTTSTRNSKSG